MLKFSAVFPDITFAQDSDAEPDFYDDGLSNSMYLPLMDDCFGISQGCITPDEFATLLTSMDEKMASQYYAKEAERFYAMEKFAESREMARQSLRSTINHLMEEERLLEARAAHKHLANLYEEEGRYKEAAATLHLSARFCEIEKIDPRFTDEHKNEMNRLIALHYEFIHRSNALHQRLYERLAQLEAQPHEISEWGMLPDSTRALYRDQWKYETEMTAMMTGNSARNRQWLADNEFEAVPNSGSNNNCLLISLLQHATGDYGHDHNERVREYRKRLINEHLTAENSQLFFVESATKRAIELINSDHKLMYKLNVTSITEVDGAIFTERIGGELSDNFREVAIWDQGGHFVAITPLRVANTSHPRI
ncbi:hypothetical protein DID99_36320 [Burkholderia sp. Bp8986]|nr:hypothetical protein DID99_36320 [Burkholderia sp. Bp8986]